MVRQNSILFLGQGYVAGFLIALLKKENWNISVASTRKNNENHESVKNLIQKFGLEKSYNNIPIISHENLENITHILVAAPPSQGTDPAFSLYGELFLRKKFPNLKWLGYLSATSVYGETSGKECSEQTPVNPISQRGKDRLTCEKTWMELYKTEGTPIHIFRLTGIYGPKRNNLDEIKNGDIISIIKPNHFTNRIYVKDIVKALYLSMNNPTAGEIFNLSDDFPASTAMVNEYCAFLLDAPVPPKQSYCEIENSLSEMRRSFYLENKIIKSDKIKNMLGFSLSYPTYREGIIDIIKEENLLEEVYLGVKH